MYPLSAKSFPKSFSVKRLSFSGVIEPSHGTLALGRPALHCLVHVHPLDVARHQRCGVYDGNASTLAQGAGLKEQQQVKGHLCLPLHETVVGDRMGKFLAHMLADVTEVEGLEVAEMHGVEQHQYRHHLAVGKAAWTVATPLA